MKQRFLVSVGVAIVALAAMASATLAGTVVELETESKVGGGGQATVYLDKNLLRIDSNEKGKRYSVIYKIGGEGTTYWLIDHGEKSYYEITPEDMKKIQSQVEESMKAVQKRMKSLPPQQRAQIEKTYQRQMGLMGRGDLMFQYNEIGTGTKVGKWSTTHYAGVLGDEKIEDVWAATWQELGAPQEDFAVVTHMAEMFSSAGQKMPAFFQFGRVRGSDAFPIMVVTYQDGQETERSEVQSVAQRQLEADLFKLPDGLTKKEPVAPPRM